MKHRGQKRICFLGVLVLVLLMLPVLSLQTFAAEAQTGETPVCYEHGDVNADGKVDSRDAIRALYHSIFEENPEYAVSQDCDFNRDGTVDSKDVMYVLYSTFSIFQESYPLEGTVHEYFEPEWTWEEDGSVTVVLKCGCGETHSFTSEDGVTIQAGKDTEVTCVNAGVKEQVASVTYEGKTFTNTRTVTTPAAGHQMEGQQNCTEGSKCSVCDFQVTSYHLEGDTCEDGVNVTRICQDCGRKTTQTDTYHITYDIAVYNLADYGMCEGELTVHGCACGHDRWINDMSSCQWDYLEGNKTENLSVCANCLTRRRIIHTEETAGQCQKVQKEQYIFSKDDKELLNISCQHHYESHREIFDLTLLGKTCEDGYTVTMRCLDCGVKESYGTQYGDHGTWAVDRKILSDGQLCGELELITYRCACGQQEHTNYEWIGDSCDFTYTHHDSETDSSVYLCENCGAQRMMRSRKEQPAGQCLRTNTVWYCFLKNGEELFQFETKDIYEAHDFLATFRMNGKTCEEGYYVDEICANCGETVYGSHQYTECRSFAVAKEQLYSGDGICGPIYFYRNSCPCGDEKNEYIQDSCSWNWYGSNNHYSIERCEDCGLEKWEKNDSQRKQGSCETTYWHDYQYFLKDQKIVSRQWEYTTKAHEYLYTLELVGESCQDGYYRTAHCAFCGKLMYERRLEYGHNRHRTAMYDLSTLGLCGGVIERYSCACGNYSNWQRQDYSCSWYYTGKTDPATGAEEIHCTVCNTYRYSMEKGSVNHETCRYEGTFLARYVRDGVEVLNLKETECQDEHQYVVESFELFNQDAGCNGGYKVNFRCAYCDYRETETDSGYSEYTMEYVDLSAAGQDLCGGYLEYRKCPCGEHSGLNWNYDCDMQYEYSTEEGADGLTHSINRRTCQNCSFVVVEDTASIYDKEACQEIRKSAFSFYIGEELFKTYQLHNVYEQHSYGDYTYTLNPGSKTCEDGVRAEASCTVCGSTTSYGTSGSHYYNVESILDLQPYGAVCKTGLAKYACACGQYQKYDLVGEEKCDMHYVSINHFVDGTIDTVQYTSEGRIWTDSESYILTCAVTDPACAFKIRMSEYWLEENCMATEYQIWQIGYDEATGKWLTEVKVPTGESHAYHPYVRENIEKTLEDGTTTSGYVDTCPKCSSTYRDQSYHLNGTYIRNEVEAINTCSNGEKQRRYEVEEYGLEHAGYRYLTLERGETTLADGRETWYQYAYTYSFSPTCTRTQVYTNSDGEMRTSQEHAHQRTTVTEVVTKKTCTQHYEYIRKRICAVCNELYSQDTYVEDPYGHWWRYNYSKGCYVCYYCGLENSNGATGSIAIEDFTEKYGEGKNYVVGYWNQNDIPFTTYVSVILDEVPADTDNEILLTNVAVTSLDRKTDGITAYVFSQEEALTAAKAALEEADYTGSYAIRFTFVPKDSDDTLDYAITFDSLDA